MFARLDCKYYVHGDRNWVSWTHPLVRIFVISIISMITTTSAIVMITLIIVVIMFMIIIIIMIIYIINARLVPARKQRRPL